jgi:cell shape-determining protein MreD
MIKIIINFILIILVILLQINFLPFFYPLDNLNLVLIVIIFLSLFFNSKISFCWAGAIGLVFDSFSLAPFPLLTGLLFLVVLSVKFFASNLFNPKSFKGYLVIALLGTLFFNLMLIVTSYLAYFFTKQLDFDQLAWQNFFWQIFLNLATFTLLFSLVKTISYQFKFRFQ